MSSKRLGRESKRSKDKIDLTMLTITEILILSVSRLVNL
jgi:hypothetical protein